MTNYNRPSKLSNEERSKLREEFVAYVDMHPVVDSPIRSPFWFSPAYFRAPIAYALILVFLFGGTAYAAERSLPSDVLYSIKTEVLEPAVLGSASISRPLKARVAVQLVERRLNEADDLAEKQRLSEAHVALLSEKIERHVAVVASVSAEASGDEAEELLDTGIDLEATLAVHTDTLTERESDDETEVTSAILAGSLRTISVKADAITADAENRFVSSLTTDAVVYIERRAAETEAAVSAGATHSANQVGQVAATSAEAELLLAEGKNAQSNGDYDKALASFREAEQVVIESKLMLDSAQD